MNLEPQTISDYAKLLNLCRAENKKLKDTLRTLIDVTLTILDDLKQRKITVNDSVKFRAAIKRIQEDL